MRTLADSPIASVSQPPSSNVPIPSETNPTIAAALFAAWSGDPAVVVASPPGAGKTSLVVQLADQLNRRAGLSVAIAAQTRVQALDVTNRAARIGASVALLGTRDSHRPLDLEPRAHYLAGVADLRRWPGVVVATTARWLWVHEREYTAEVCVCDEAWQMTWADLGGLGPLSAQVVLVGDPGQIAPVVTGDSRRWEHLPAAPQRAAPEALLAAYPDSVTRLRLPCTWRLGPDTTALIQPAFYADLPFESARPPRHVELRGAALPEIGLELQSPLAGPGDACPAAAAANRVRDLLQGGAIVEGSERSRALEPRDLAVITPHVEQASAVTARLADVPGVLIGTANQAQGLEREAVVVIHPLAGYREAPSFATDPGRLCVALSRHRSHVTVICDVGTETVLRHAQAEAPNDTALAIQRHVLAGLLRTADDGLYLTQGGVAVSPMVACQAGVCRPQLPTRDQSKLTSRPRPTRVATRGELPHQRQPAQGAICMAVRALEFPQSPAGDSPPIASSPSAWQDTRWLGQQSGYTTSRDLLAGAWVSPEARRTVSRLYAAACADLAQATVGGLPPHSADWERWFAALRTTARQLSPSQAGAHVVRRALHHGQRLEGPDAPWSHHVRRGFAALLAASLPEPVPGLIGEDLVVFRRHDDAWLAQDATEDGAVQARPNVAIQDVQVGPPDPERFPPNAPARWPTSKLRPHPLNPRGALTAADVAELCASIVAHAAQGGILQPLLVTPDGTVVAGHRRLAAARQAGLQDVPVVVCALSPIDQLTAQLTENLQRADLSPVQEARAYCHLLDAGATQASIARAVCVPASRVRERLALLDLDSRVQDMVHSGDLPLRVALQLVPLRDQTHQLRLARHAVRRRLTVAQVRNLIETALHLPPAQDAPRPADDERDDEEPPGPSVTRQAALDALRAEPDRPITYGQLADLATRECCACGLSSAPAICEECPNLHLLRAVLQCA